jgi:hypothetical protein
VIAEEVVHSTLAAASTVTAVVGTRIHETIAPLSSSYPCIVYRREGTQYHPTIHTSVSVLRQVRMTIACWAKSATEARALCTIVEAVVTNKWHYEDKSAEHDDTHDAYGQILLAVVEERT